MKALAHALKNTQVQMLLITISVALFVSATSSINLVARV
jgi:hypothetical protein